MDKPTPRLIVDRFGGGTRLAGLLGCKPSAISNWMERGRIPASRWPDLIQVAEREGMLDITFEALRSAHTYSVAAADAA